MFFHVILFPQFTNFSAEVNFGLLGDFSANVSFVLQQLESTKISQQTKIDLGRNVSKLSICIKEYLYFID